MKNNEKRFVFVFFETLLFCLVLLSCIYINARNSEKTSKAGTFSGQEQSENVTFSDLAEHLEEKYFFGV